MTDWRPSATIAALEARAALLRAAREYFAAQGVLEVETPVLCAHTTTETGIASLQIAANGPWLRTSPEHHMKRLLAAGAPDIYQIGKVFRAGESGHRHYPEFTMLEWYRRGFTLDDLIAECCELINTLLVAVGGTVHPVLVRGYRAAFLTATQLDPLTAGIAELATFAGKLPGWHADLGKALGNDRSAWLDLITGMAVYPALPTGTLVVVRDYPAEQAMLARLNPDNPAVAERFEIFMNGIELANGFRELSDATEQRRRFARDNALRRERGLPVIAIDTLLLDALDAGLPDCSGVAVGLDRIHMLAAGAASLDAVASFAPGA